MLTVVDWNDAKFVELRVRLWRRLCSTFCWRALDGYSERHDLFKYFVRQLLSNLGPLHGSWRDEDQASRRAYCEAGKDAPSANTFGIMHAENPIRYILSEKDILPSSQAVSAIIKCAQKQSALDVNFFWRMSRSFLMRFKFATWSKTKRGSRTLSCSLIPRFGKQKQSPSRLCLFTLVLCILMIMMEDKHQMGVRRRLRGGSLFYCRRLRAILVTWRAHTTIEACFVRMLEQNNPRKSSLRNTATRICTQEF